MAGVTIGFLKFVLGFDTVAFKKGMSQAERELVVMQKNFKKVGDGLTNLGKSMSLAVTLPLIGIGAAAIKMAANFETAMNEVSISTKATAAEMQTMKDLALDIGKDTTKSASEAANAMDMLAKAGMATTDIINGGAKATVALAEAAGSELEPAAAAVTDAMSQFELKTSDLPKIINQITGAVNESKFAFDDFTYGMSQGGGVAASAGLEFDEFAAALAATSSQFSSGQDAGTSFKTFLLRLIPDTKKAATAMSNVGFEAYDATGNLKPLRDIAEQLNVKFGKMSEGDRLAQFKVMFGQDAVRTAIGLYKAGGKGIDEMMAKLAATDAGKQAAMRMKGFNAELEKLKGSLETAAIKLADAGVLTAITNFVSKLGELVDKFSELDPKTKNMILTIAAFAAAIGPVMIVLGPIVRLVGAMLPHLAKLGPLLGGVGVEAGAAAGTIGPLATVALPALTAALGVAYLAWKDWDDIKPILDDINLGLKESQGLAARFGGEQTWGEAFGEQLGHIWNRIKEGEQARADLGRWADTFRANFIRSTNETWTAFDAWRGRMQTSFDKLMDGIYKSTSTGFERTQKRFETATNWIKDRFNWLSDILVGHSIVPDMVDSIGKAMIGLEAKMVEPAKKATAAVKAQFEKMAEFADRLRGLLDRLFPAQAASIQYRKDLADIDEGLRQHKLTLEAAAEARAELEKQYAAVEEEPGWWEKKPRFMEDEGPFAPLADPSSDSLETMVSYYDTTLAKMGDLTKTELQKMAEGWGEMASSAIDSMKGMVDAFKSGDILGGIKLLLDTVLAVVQSLRSMGAFGMTAAPAATAGSYGGARAMGGPVVPGKSYTVGENGPEFFSTKRRGFIHPNGREAEPQKVMVVPSPYFDIVVDNRAARVAAPMAGQAAIIGVTGSEARLSRRSRRNLLAA
jgi:TP901 family phage tail tape measure protein